MNGSADWPKLTPMPRPMTAFLFQSGALRSTIFRTSRTCLPLTNKTALLRAKQPPKSAQLRATLTTDNSQHTVDQLLKNGLGVVVLKRGKARLFRDGGNTIVFAGAVERCISASGNALQNCDAVAVCDGKLSCIGFGFFNSQSMFRVRMLRHAAPQCDELHWDYAKEISERVREAMLCRQSIGLPRSDTTTYRLVNGDGDKLSGLVVDRVAHCVVVSSSAIWCERYAAEIRSALKSNLPECSEIIWRRNVDRLRQDGWEGDFEQIDDGEVDDILVREGGVVYCVSRYALTRGQKTGHYADQRENRAWVGALIGSLAHEPKVLDLFCYTGGFALNAALANEKCRVIAIDSSAKAIAMGNENARLNHVEDRVQFVEADVGKYLQTDGRDMQKQFDVVIVDPPKFAPNAKSLSKAVHKYRSLNAAAIGMVKTSGLLCTCTCSAAMTSDRKLFIDTIRRAGAQVGREITLVKTFGAAADHGVAAQMLETEYLTMCVFVCR